MITKETETTVVAEDTVAATASTKKPATKKSAAKKPAAKKASEKKPTAKKAPTVKAAPTKAPTAKPATTKEAPPTAPSASAAKPADAAEGLRKAEKSTQVSEAFLQEMRKKLDELKSVTRLQVAERLKEAIALGDLSENSEYEDAKNQQAFVEGEIAELEEKIRTAKIVQAPKGKNIGLGSVVTLEDEVTKERITYTIVGSAEADPFADKISDESPVGKALMHHKKGDTVIVQAPEQELRYTITDIQNKPVKRTKK